ncbi:MAG: Ig-like domain repeat protein [Bacilli bacterium]|nr:Ig-like domain repeat protein [Bacilli bacterium]
MTVQDTTLPTVTIGKVKTGYVGVAYKLPAVTYEDASGNCELSVKVILTGTSETEITVENNQFTPTEAGNYEIRATATDASGNIGSASKAFEVKAEKDPADPKEVIDFNDEDETCVSKNPARDAAYTFEILDEYENEEGVLKVTTSDDCTTIVLRQMAHEKSHYAEYDNVVVRMLIPSDKRVHHLQMNNETSKAAYRDLDGQVSQIVYDEWHDYRFEASVLTATNDIWPNIFMYTYAAIEGSIYIADISVEKVAQVNIATPETGTVGTEYALPEITTKNFVGTPTIETKVYILGEGETKTEVTVADGKFTPETAGQYLIEVTVTDEAGNSVTKTAEFTVTAVIDVPRENEVRDNNQSLLLEHVPHEPRFD